MCLKGQNSSIVILTSANSKWQKMLSYSKVLLWFSALPFLI